MAILGFANGERVVYKPKDLRVATAFAGLVRALNAAGLEPPRRSLMLQGNTAFITFAPSSVM